MHEEDYDPGLCVGCEWCYWGSPRNCPKCKISEEDENEEDENEEE